MKASHYVIEDIIKSLEDSDTSEVCEKFAHRYTDDKELVEILSVKSPKAKKIKELLTELLNKRKFTDGSGGSSLWMSDTRKGSAETTLR